LVGEQIGTQPSRAGGRIAAVDGLRGLAALYVLSVHLTTFLVPGDRIAQMWASFLTANPWLGSRTFLVISGCIVYRSMLSGKTPVKDFWKRRLIRLYPIYFAVLAVYLIASLLMPAESKIPADPLAAFTYVLQNVLLLQGLTARPAIITQSWTLTFFLAAYLIIPFVTSTFRYLAFDRKCRVCVLAVAALAVSTALGPWSAYTSLLFGMIAAEIAAMIPNAGFMGQCGLVAAGTAAWMIGEVPGALLCVIVLVMAVGSPLNRLLTSTSLAWIGKRSYALYLSHGLAIHAIAIIALRRPAFAELGVASYWAAQMLVFSGALSLAAFLHRYVDEPVTRWFNAVRPAVRTAPAPVRQTIDLAARDTAMVGSGR
jgi:peptidoglycan/LPS O-acetylase OafA/YrhL